MCAAQRNNSPQLDRCRGNLQRGLCRRRVLDGPPEADRDSKSTSQQERQQDYQVQPEKCAR
jgi:ferredoxin